MRILHIAAGDTWGGAEQALSLLIEAQVSSCKLSVSACLFNEGRLADRLRAQGCPVVIIAEQGRTLLEMRADLVQYLRREQFDIVHTHRSKETLLASTCRAPGDGKLFVTLHGMEPWAQQGLARALKLWGVLWLARVTGGSFIGVSGELAQRLRASLRTTRVAQIPNIYRLPQSREEPSLALREVWPESVDRPLIGFVGRLEDVKAPERMLDLAARRHLDACIAIIGTGNLHGMLQRRIENEGLGDRVRLFGEVTDAPSLLGQLDVLALPSRHEGLPMILLEAAAASLPVTAFSVGGTSEILDGSLGAQLVEPGDVPALERALKLQTDDLDQAKAAAASWARSVAENFAPEKIARQLLEFYLTRATAPNPMERPA